MSTLSPETFFFALTGGILPALLWLWFWLQEDRLHPEPRAVIVRTFMFGMIAVPLVLPLEQYIQSDLANIFAGTIFAPITVIFLWSCAEEVFKLLAALFGGLESRAYDEAIDAVIYLVTAALGFAAMENVFFLIASLSNTTAVASIVTGNLRFIGATLLHVLCSGTIGYFLGISFCSGWFGKKMYLLFGIATSVAIHTIFNVYVTRSQGSSIFIVFCFVWVAILLLIVGFEKVKKIRQCPIE